MNFDFEPEQIQIADTVRRLVEKDYGFEARKAIVESAAGSSDAMWSQLVELGLTALPMPESAGGFDGSAVDLLLVMQELGRGLVAEPFFATVVAGEFVKRCAGDAQRGLLAQVADGSLKMSFALVEPASRYELDRVDTTLAPAPGGFRLAGRKSVVPFGAQVDRLVVSARMQDGALALVVVDAAADGVTRRDQRTLDGQRVADIAFDTVLPADALLASGPAAEALLDAVSDYAIALLAAEAVGVMEALNAATLDYAKQRKQFGQPIARFQVLQHRMVEMFMHLEQARSMAYLAAVKAGAVADASDADVAERQRIASAAKVRVGQAARYIGQQAVQIHGGMGVTNELPAAHLFKRLTMIELTLGDTDHHLQRFIAASDDGVTARSPDVAHLADEPLPEAA